MKKVKEPALNSYLITCFRNWIIDCGEKTHICIDAAQLNDPKLLSYVRHGQLILNIDPGAISNYVLDDNGMAFNCRFSGQDRAVYIPLSAIITVFAQGDPGKSCVLPPLFIDPPAVELTVASDSGTPPTATAAVAGNTNNVVAVDFAAKKK